MCHVHSIEAQPRACDHPDSNDQVLHPAQEITLYQCDLDLHANHKQYIKTKFSLMQYLTLFKLLLTKTGKFQFKFTSNFLLALIIEWKPLIMITLGPALFDNNNRLITLSGGYKNLHYLTQFIVTIFYMYKKQQNLFKKLM